VANQDINTERIIEMSRHHGYLAQRLYVMHTAPLGSPDLISLSLAAHLAYWVDLEKKNVLFAAGPFLPDHNNAMIGPGMVIFRANSIEKATEIAKSDPMHKSGARGFTLSPWLLNHLNVQGLDIEPE
jgi:uncharacterized protein YciI